MPKLDNMSIIGKRFGRLKVIAFSHIKKRKTKTRYRFKYFFKCQCDCGKIKNVHKWHLTQSQIKSCGCLRAETAARSGREKAGSSNFKKILPNGQSALNIMYGAYRKGCKRRGFKFELSRKKFKYFTSQPCFYCGSEPSILKIGASILLKYNGIDRVDNNRGYIKSNCVTCCKRCNYMKGTLSFKNFIMQAIKISKLNDARNIEV